MRLHIVLAAMLLVGCSSKTAPVAPTPADPTKESWYPQVVSELVALNREAESLLASGQADKAGAAITKGQPLMARLLTAPRPTLAAVQAASDLDQLYGRMLLSNKHHGWARMVFQKDVARWKNWEPQDEESARRRKLAEAAVALCDREMVK